MAELGKIQRPDASQFSGKRKLYCVANIYPVENAESDFQNLVAKYWDEVSDQIEKIEAAGQAQKIFCEIVYQEGDEALDVLTKMNERMAAIIKQKIGKGSKLVPLEKKEILGPYSDWGNCLRVVFTKEVFSKILGFYKEFADRRHEHFMSVIDSNLAEAEAGLLFMKDDDRARIQFPKDIEVFLITPPSYDDIMRWLREKARKGLEEQDQTG